MSKDKPGPELDRRVATVLGTEGTHNTNPCDIPYVTSGMTDPPYSTDPTRIQEMNDWLTKEREHWAGSDDPTIDLGRNTATASMLWRVWEHRLDGTRQSVPMGCDRTGETIQHALALLVCAVAEAEHG
jgi:hypothetical protein